MLMGLVKSINAKACARSDHRIAWCAEFAQAMQAELAKLATGGIWGVGDFPLVALPEMLK